VLVTMKRACTVLTALHACFWRGLPAGAESHGTLRKCEHTDDRRDSFQNRPHVCRMRCHRQSVNARSISFRAQRAGERNSRPSAHVYIGRGDPVRMCQRVQCQKCGKPTWVGCGRHVEDVLRDVPPAQRCDCPRPKSFLARLLGR